MAEDGFADDRLTLLVLSDVTLFGNDDELREFEPALVHATRQRLLAEGYAYIIEGDGQRRPVRARLTTKGYDLSGRLRQKLQV